MDTVVNRTFPSLDLLSYRSSVLFQLLKRSAPEIAAVMRPIGIQSQSAFGWLAALMLHQAFFSLRRARRPPITAGAQRGVPLR